MVDNELQEYDCNYFGSLWDELNGDEDVYRDAERGIEQTAGQEESKDAPAIW
jgi:hypothetical protein